MTHQKRRDQARTLISSAPPHHTDCGRVVIVANRLPVTLVDDGQHIEVRPSSGGLATGLSRVQQRHRARWVGWTGVASGGDDRARRETEMQLGAMGMTPVHLSHAEVARFYGRYSNGVLWPALHDMDAAASDYGDWSTYCDVNARFADAIVRELRIGDLVWIHDYHLMLVPRLVRERCPQARIGFFLHTPFPRPESFMSVRHAASLLHGLLAADVIGVHTEEYAGNLRAAADANRGRRRCDDFVRRGGTPRVFACPMSVDVAALGAIAARDNVRREAERIRGDGPVFVGVDRLDYTKGIPERLRAFDRMLESDAALRGHARLVQVAVPSREGVVGYAQVRGEVESTVARINARWGGPSWQPIQYQYGTVDLATLIALYRAADVMLVTPLRDGLNLVAKEFVASRVDNDGVLVLSERAGAAAELRAALLVDPRDEGSMADAYLAALNMLPAERRVRMRHLRSTVTNHDVYHWAEYALGTVATSGDARSRATRG
jgi:trehalose 6-phosphate synthase/phosphatase